MNLLELLGTPCAELESHTELVDQLTQAENIEGRVHIDAPVLGLGFTDHGNGIVGSIHVHVLPQDGVAAFTGELPSGLSRTMSRPEVRGVLGDPESSGEAVTLPVLGPMPPWDRFAVEDEILVHVQYRLDAPGLSLVTLMMKDVAPA